MEGCFSNDYSEAQAKFRAAATGAGCELKSYALAARAPSGVELSTDIAWLGPSGAKRVLVTISGTHGVEGFFGSATQIEWLRRAKAPLPNDVAVLHVHAINPYGFAWLRRTNEQNVDINRNFIDFDLPLPENALYDELADDLCPADWSIESRARTDTRITEWVKSHSPAVFQKAVSSGQWKHPRGLFYGGTAPSWSRTTLKQILHGNLLKVARVNIIDFHTGLGAYGYAEPIIGRRRTDPGFDRTRAWIGAGAKSLHGDGSISSEIIGDSLSVLPGLLPHAVVDAVALECGIKPIPEVALALRADAWLHAHGDLRSPEAKEIQSRIRGAFHSDDLLWQGMALGQGLAACAAGLAGLNLD